MATPSIIVNSNSSSETTQTEPNLCNAWNLNDNTQTGCIFYNHTIKCHNGIDDFIGFENYRMRRTHRIILCGLPNITFESNIFTKFPKLKSLHFEYGLLTNMSANFPKLNHLQVGNPVYNGYIRDLRCNLTVTEYQHNIYAADTCTKYIIQQSPDVDASRFTSESIEKF